MQLSLKKRKYIFYSLMFLTLVFVLVPFFYFSSYELGYSIELVLNNLIVIGLLSFVFCFYTKDIMFRPTKIRNRFLNNAMKVFEILFGAMLSFIFIVGMLSGMLLSFNGLVGSQVKINIDSEVVDSETSGSKNRIKHYYVTINIPNENRKVELKVYRPYDIGERYKGLLYKGSLNMYYAK